MSDALEHELRAALAERASAMPAADDAIGRLGAVDYRAAAPGRLSAMVPWPRPWQAIGGAAALLASGIVAAVLLLSSGATAAYAGWTAVPTKPTSVELALADKRCKRVSGPLAHHAMQGRLVLSDERGAYVAEMFANGIDTGVCIWREHGGVTGVGGDAVVLGFYAEPGPRQLGIPGGGGGSAPGFEGQTGPAAIEIHRYGRAGSDVTAVEFKFSDGSTVDATVENGWYFAWWPNQNEPTSVRVTLRSGDTVTSPMSGPECRPSKGRCPLFAGFQPRSPGQPMISTTGTSTTPANTTTAGGS